MTTVRDFTPLRSESVPAGPIMRRYRLRALAVWAAVALLGIVPTLLSAPPAWRAAGLGLWFPGAGFLYGGQWWATPITLVTFAVSLVAWLAVGGFIFPVLVWGSAAALSALTVAVRPWAAAQWLVPLATIAAVALLSCWLIWRRGVAAKAGAVINQQLQDVPYLEPQLKCSTAGELDEHQLAEARHLMDRVLQPIDRFDGFTTIDQFREAAWRYQLVSINYALAALQVNYLPAFSGYLHEAQRNSIVKMTDRRVWHYWRVENFLGNLKFGADPIRHENIMYSGWWALALGAYERATGDTRFSEPAALTLVDTPRRQYAYDYPAIVAALVRQFDDGQLCFFPCEPNWVFTVCNLYGMTGVLLFDRQHGTEHGLRRLEHFNGILESEFSRCDGRSVMVASRRTGLAVTSTSPLSAHSDTWLVNIVSPRQAQVAWALARRHHLDATDGDLTRIQPRGGDLLDPGTYRLTGSWFWAGLMASAREMGDDELYGIAESKFDDLVRDSDKAAGLFARAFANVGRFGAKDTWHRFAHGDVPSSVIGGPRLADAPYGTVQVAHASNDGNALRLVLRPHDGKAVQPSLDFGGLRPQRTYRVLGTAADSTLTADHLGNGGLTLAIDQRTELVVAPAD